MQLLLIQAFSYAVPSWGLGLLAAQGNSLLDRFAIHIPSHSSFFCDFELAFMLGVSIWFKEKTGVPLEPILTYIAVLTATFLGN